MATHSSIPAGKLHGQRSLVGYSPWDRKRVGHGLASKQQQQKSICIHSFQGCTKVSPR